MRKLISSGFTPRMIRRLDEQIMDRTTRVLDAAAAAGTCNFVQDVAYQLPMHVIADIMGIPEADRREVFGWTDTIMAAPDPESGISREDHFLAGVQLYEYARALGEDKRRNPTDDVWSILTTAEIDGEDGETWRLTGPELDQFFLILSIAGSETTRSAISGGLIAFRDRPDQWDRVRSDPVAPRQRGRGDPAVGVSRRVLRPHEHLRRRARRPADRGRRPREHVVPGRQP